MEVNAAAKIMWKDLRALASGTQPCSLDGDSKSFLELKERNVYGSETQIKRRMYQPCKRPGSQHKKVPIWYRLRVFYKSSLARKKPGFHKDWLVQEPARNIAITAIVGKGRHTGTPMSGAERARRFRERRSRRREELSAAANPSRAPLTLNTCTYGRNEYRYA
ncbi:hypothetical protein TNCV_207231 [Trichonephila clavipes]|nr:hypothetical protein TNCV_207231 [Trichonephila clavipes]